MDSRVARPRPFYALFLRLFAALALATMGMLVKLSGQHGVQLLELIFWRQAVTLVLVTLLLAVWGRLATLRTARFGAHARRAIYGIVGMMFVYGAIRLLPLAEATAISFTAPFFAVLLAVVLLHERVGWMRWSAIALGFAGVLLVVQPGGAEIDPVGVVVALVAAFLVALISIQLQDLNTTESPFSIIFWFCALTTPVMALTLPFVTSAHSPAAWWLILATSLAGAIAQLLLTFSLRFGSAASVIVMDYSALIWATLYGWLVFDTIPSKGLWLGAPLIVAAGVIVTLRERTLALNRRQGIAPD